MWTKNELSEMLRNRRLEVSFIKKDGSLRVMNCTLLEKYLPTNDKETTKKENDSVLSVWDIDNNGWRSFRLDSITEVRIVIND
jgi:hypothetical protein